MDYKEIFSEVYKSLQNDTTSNIAKKIGLPQQTLNSYVNREYEPRLSTLWKLADYFNCTIDELVGRKEKSKNEVEA